MTLTIADTHGLVRADELLDTIQELRAAGAEAIEVNALRVVDDTHFSGTGDGMRVDGKPVSAPYRF